ncbi:MAG: YqhA family protein [Nitrospirae bacterium]|nr:YqhA family protein [Nitrospirota bacterium]
MVERLFEAALWRSRFIVILAVVSSLMSAVILFLTATADVIGIAVRSLGYALGPPHLSEEYEAFHSQIVGHIISSVDDYLLATVLLIFSLGLYELFISKIDVAQEDARHSSKILLIQNLDDLKDRLAKVVLMILIVTFFKNVIHTSFSDPLGILYLGIGILFVALALYFTGKSAHAGEK